MYRQEWIAVDDFEYADMGDVWELVGDDGDIYDAEVRDVRTRRIGVGCNLTEYLLVEIG